MIFVTLELFQQRKVDRRSRSEDLLPREFLPLVLFHSTTAKNTNQVDSDEETMIYDSVGTPGM
jgi:hypothetical protein